MQTNYSTPNRDNQSINLTDLLFYLASKWIWFSLSILLCGGLAWLYYARSPLVYFRTATVIIKDPSNKTSSAAGLDRYDNFINKVNVANEILQFQSKNLIREVVHRLHADVSYRMEDGLRQKELYKKTPVIVTFLEAEPESDASLTVTLKDGPSAEVTWMGKEEKSIPAKLNDTIAIPNGKILLTLTDYYNDRWIGQTIHVRKSPISATTAYFRGMLGIRQEKEESSILILSLKDSSPERAEDMLNTLITVYNEEAINDKNQVAVNTANFINERLIIIEKELGGVESDLESFKRSNQIVDINSAAERYMGESQKYNADAMELETQLRLARHIQEYLTDPAKETDLIPANTGIKDVDLESQINQYNAMRLRRDKLIADSSDQNPVVEELNNSLRSLRQTIIRAIDNFIVSINVRIRDAQSYETMARARVSSIPTKERQMLSIERQQKIKETLYMFLLNRREENALSQAMADNNARVIDSTDGSNAPIAPNRNRIIAVGLLIGLALPGIGFLIALFLDTRVHTRKDVQAVLSVPFLGEVPLDKKRKKGGEKAAANAWGDKERDRSVAEAMRILRTNMAFLSRKERNTQVITFTSFSEGAGKSFIARHLALSLVYARKRVVVLDLDIRKGTLSRALLPKHHIGVTNYLADPSIKVDDLIHKGEERSTPDLIGAGAIAPNPAELLMDERLDQLIAELRTRYDYIIADNVPLGIIADASIANRVADLTLFVIRAGRLDRRQLPDIEALYQERKLNNMALVLNGIDPNRWGYGAYGYGYGYGHYGYGNYGYAKS